jgi:hypothetical protein
MTPLAWHNIVYDETLDPAIILDPRSTANSVNSLTRTFDSTFNIANDVAGHEDLCDGLFPVEPIFVSESVSVRKTNDARKVSEANEFDGLNRGIRS